METSKCAPIKPTSVLYNLWLVDIVGKRVFSVGDQIGNQSQSRDCSKKIQKI